MYCHKKILGFIPARGGSKGIPDKNIYPTAGKPLIAWTIESAKKSAYLDDVYVSTNDESIAQVSSFFGAHVIERPNELATDSATTISAVMHAIKVLKEQGKEYDYIMILQPTCPLRTAEQIDACIRQAVDNNQESVVSVHAITHYPFLIRHIDQDETGSRLNRILPFSSTIRRQDAPIPYYVDGVLYLHKTSILSANTSLNDATHGFVIDSATSMDINTLDELLACEKQLNTLSK